jgi:hypothetical protein
VKSHAHTVNAKLTDTIAAIDRAIAVAQTIRASSAASDAATSARELQSLIQDIGVGLLEAEQEMRAIMKAEGL